MKQVSVEIRKEIIKYYQNHNTAQTAEQFVLSKESILRYVKRYDGTDESLIDRRTVRVSRSYSEKETALLQNSLEKYNKENRKRNVITPTYTEIYCGDAEYKQIPNSEMQHFLDLFTDLSNHTRMPSNRGFRPTEMLGDRKLGLPKQITFGPGMQESIRNGELSDEEFKRMILSQSAWPTELKESMVAEIEKALRPGEEKWIGGTVYKGAKIGPNDPCPCGSGKKYKKCCGKKELIIIRQSTSVYKRNRRM